MTEVDKGRDNEQDMHETKESSLRSMLNGPSPPSALQQETSYPLHLEPPLRTLLAARDLCSSLVVPP